MLAGWGEYVAAWGMFLLSHSLPVRPPVKPWLVARLGRGGYLAGYSLLSVALLAWLIVAAGRAPHVVLWYPSPWQVHATQIVTLAACLLLALALLRPNPLSFGGARNAEFDPARPGIVGWVRHPVLAALGLWAAGHVPPNGDLAHVLMFGGFAGFALAGMVLIDRRRRRALGAAEWARLAAVRRGGLAAGWPLRLVAGGALWLGLVALHPLVIGLPVLRW